MNNYIENAERGSMARIVRTKELRDILEGREKISPEELSKLFEMYKPVEIRKYPNISKLGVSDEDVEVSIKNFQVVDAHIRKAMDDKYFIEATSLILQYIDFYLRGYYTYHSGEDVKKSQSFGKLITLCEEELSFDFNLAQKIRDFNGARIKMIHRFFLGECSLESIKDEMEKYKNLHNEIKDYVGVNSGDLV